MTPPPPREAAAAPGAGTAGVTRNSTRKHESAGAWGTKPLARPGHARTLPNAFKLDASGFKLVACQ